MIRDALKVLEREGKVLNPLHPSPADQILLQGAKRSETGTEVEVEVEVEMKKSLWG